MIPSHYIFSYEAGSLKLKARVNLQLTSEKVRKVWTWLELLRSTNRALGNGPMTADSSRIPADQNVDGVTKYVYIFSFWNIKLAIDVKYPRLIYFQTFQF